jgi:glycosyltransferase involved in cell wall biosynthesis
MSALRTLIVSDLYPPEVGSASQLMSELSKELDQRGHAVTVLTGWPEHRLDSSAPAAQIADRTMEGKVQVLRVRTLPLHNSGFVVRGFAQLSAPFAYRRVLRRYESAPFDNVIVYSPPLTLASVGRWEKARGSRFLLNVQDLFPQNAIDLGILTNPLAIALFRYIERSAYGTADIVTVHSKRNGEMLVKANPQIARKLEVLHNWIDLSEDKVPEESEDFREKYGLQGKFVFFYGGVVGPAQGLDIVLDTAVLLRDLSDVVFLIVGDGTEKARLEKEARLRGLTNVMFRPFVSRERFPALLRVADVGFLTLSPKMKTPVVPGKLLSFMSAALPVLAIVNAESDARTIIADAQCGYSCLSDDATTAASLVRRLYFERAQARALGCRGHAYAKRHFEKARIVSRLEALLQCADRASGLDDHDVLAHETPSLRTALKAGDASAKTHVS